LQGRAILGPELLLDHGSSLLEGLWVNRLEGPKIGAKQPVSETMIFRLH